MVCLEDRCKVCDDCVHEGAHFGHKVRLLKKMQGDVNTKLHTLENTLETHDKYWKQVSQVFEETRGKFLEATREEISNLKWLLTVKELELTYEINSFFDQEKRKLEQNILQGSDVRNTIQQKINSLQDVFHKTDFLDIVEEDLTELLAIFDPNILKEKLQNLETGFKDTLKAFDTGLVGQVQPFIALLEFPSEELLGRSEEIALVEDDGKTKKVCFEKQKQQPGMELEGASRINKSSNILVLDQEYLEEIRNMTAGCKENKITPNTNLTVKSLWKKFQETLAIQLDFTDIQVSDRNLFDCYLLTTWATKSLECFDISLKNSQVPEYSVIPLLSEILPKMEQLKALQIDLSYTKISDRSITAFPSAALPNIRGLRELSVDFSGTSVTDSPVIELFSYLTGLKKFSLGLESTKITEKSLKVLAKALAAMPELESLTLNVRNTQISEQTFCELLNILCNIKSLSVNFGATKTGDHALSAFIAYGLPQMTTLEELALSFEGSQVTYDGISQLTHYLFTRRHVTTARLSEKTLKVKLNSLMMVTPEPGVFEMDFSGPIGDDQKVVSILRSLGNLCGLKLWLNGAGITDLSLKFLAENVLPVVPELRELEVCVAGTSVGDLGVAEVFKRLGKMERLVLDLSNTGITDKSIEAFLENIENLKDGMEINLGNTIVSDEYKNIITQVSHSCAQRG